MKFRFIIGQGRKINCRKFDPEKFREHIDRTSWDDILASQDVNVATSLFHETFTAIAEVHAPHKTITIKENAPAWVTGEYLSHVDEKKDTAKL